jgi:S-adenosylmethionine hydrolase
MRFITFLTDFGLRDGYTGVVKGVIWKIAPDVQIADLSHSISAQNMLEGALALGRAAPYFPDGTIHLAVVDPGVGTARRPIAAQLGSQFFVGPDNGLLTLLLEHARRENTPVEIVHLNQPRYWLPEVSNVFHGRDIFAPVAAHLANGVHLSALGTTIQDAVELSFISPQKLPNGWRGQIVSIDHFGNAQTNLLPEHLQGMASPRVKIAGVEIKNLVKTYGEAPAGELTVLFGSSGELEIAINQGSAAEHLQIHVGDPLDVLA